MIDAKWLEVSIVVDGELAEAVSEVFSRFVSGGVVIESIDIAPDPEGEGEVIGPLRVCGYLLVDSELEMKQQRLEEALWHLGQIRKLPEARYEIISQSDWSENWKDHFKPILIGERLLIAPTWLEIEEGSLFKLVLPDENSVFDDFGLPKPPPLDKLDKEQSIGNDTSGEPIEWRGMVLPEPPPLSSIR